MKLTQEQHEALSDLLENKEGIRVLVSLLDAIVADVEKDVITMPLTVDTEADLVHKKARAEGARKVLTSLLLTLKLKK